MKTNGAVLWRIGLRSLRENRMKNKILKAIPFLLNLIFIGLIIYFIIQTDSDKSPIIFIILYPILFLLNLITLIIFSVLKNKIYSKIIRHNILLLLILIIPMIIIISSI